MPHLDGPLKPLLAPEMVSHEVLELRKAQLLVMVAVKLGKDDLRLTLKLVGEGEGGVGGRNNGNISCLSWFLQNGQD